jgi:hypothetical protein
MAELQHFERGKLKRITKRNAFGALKSVSSEVLEKAFVEKILSSKIHSSFRCMTNQMLNSEKFEIAFPRSKTRCMLLVSGILN